MRSSHPNQNMCLPRFLFVDGSLKEHSDYQFPENATEREIVPYFTRAQSFKGSLNLRNFLGGYAFSSKAKSNSQAEICLPDTELGDVSFYLISKC